MTLQTEDKTVVCKRCQSEAFVKNDFVRRHQRYRCKVWSGCDPGCGTGWHGFADAASRSARRSG